MSRVLRAVLLLGLTLLLTGCGAEPQAPREQTVTATQETESSPTVARETDGPEQPEEEDESIMQMKIDGTLVAVAWEENESVDALRALTEKEPLTMRMSMYGGFEQVGSIGQSLPRNDVQTTTGAGDIVLYSGSQIVVFYGSNSWAYTRLGRISDKTADELAALLGNGDVTITIG